MKIVFTGGGTGGHVLPLVALSREIRRLDHKKEARIVYMGPKDDFAELLLSQEGIPFSLVVSGKIRRYGGVKPILLTVADVLFKIPFGIFMAFWKLFFFAPDIVFSKGGYGSLPVTIASWVLRIPLILHESDATPGMANRVAARFASRLFVSFPKTSHFPLDKMVVAGNLIRKELLGGSAKEAKRLFSLKGDKPLLVVLGGSQGAARINDTILAIGNELLKEFEVVHLVGQKNADQIKKEAKVLDKEAGDSYHPEAFLRETDLRHAYAAADLIISRAGSGAVFEIAALEKPSILIPLQGSAQDHQVANAYAYASSGAAIVLEETNLTPHFFLEKLRYLFSHPAELEEMRQAARAFAKPDAARVLAQYILGRD